MARRVAWTLAMATLVLVVTDAVVTAQYRSLLSEEAVAVHGFPFVSGAVVGCALMGALIIARQDRHVIGWLLSGIGFTTAVSLLAEAYSGWVSAGDGPGSAAAGGISGWVSQMLGGQLSIAALVLMFLLAPDGHFLSRRWRYVAYATAAGTLSCVAGLLTLDPAGFELVEEDSDAAPAMTTLLLSVGFLVIAAGLFASLVSMLLRLRRSHGVARQQVRLIAISAALLAVGMLALFVVQLFNGGRQTWAASLPLFVAYLLLPILFAVAVLRYRLFDVEVIINRTLLVAAGTVFAAAGYTLLVVVVGRLVGSRTSGFWLSLSATALVALAFQPLRRHAVRLANRLAYGPRAQPYEALSDFSRRLGEVPAPDTLLPAVAEAAGRAVSARGARATLRLPGGRVAEGTWGAGDEQPTSRPDGDPAQVIPAQVIPAQVIPVRHGGVTLGSIEVTPARGRALRASDQRLLGAMADRAAVALRNTAMEAQLAADVAALDRTALEIERSRGRIIQADDAARRTLEGAIARDVLTHLVPLPEEIERSRRAVLDGRSDHGLDRLVECTNRALEALRELSRGVFPTQLSRSGLEPSLRSNLRRSTGPGVVLEVDPSARGRRFTPRVEAAVYFCGVEVAPALPTGSTMRLAVADDALVLDAGPLQPDAIDLQAITDRVEAVAGSLSLRDQHLMLHIPVGPDAGHDAGHDAGQDAGPDAGPDGSVGTSAVRVGPDL